MEYTMGFGKKNVSFNVNNFTKVQKIIPNDVEIKLKGEEEVKRALKNPINSKRLKNIIKRGEKIVIITSDITRPMPSKKVLPFVLQELYSCGVTEKDITIVLALGSHRSHTEDEKKYIVGEEIYNKIKCVDSNSGDFINIGRSSEGTPIDIFKPVAQADRIICLGNIEYHYFAGYSGGSKAVMPGVSTKSAIKHNHSKMIEADAKSGNIITNPIRKDIDEVGGILGIDFIVNVVLDEKKEIIKAVAGNYIDAHREGCKFLDSFYKIEVENKYDIVITTPGGYPKDINLYQSQKALDNAKHIVKENGIIILIASCKEGLGQSVFEDWMTKAEKPQDLIDMIKKDFQLGGHKAAAIASILDNAAIYLVSELENSFVESIFMKPYSDVQSAVDDALQKLGENSTIAFMPYGGSTLPTVRC